MDIGTPQNRDRVNRSKWRSNSIPVKKDMRSPEESRGKVLRRRGGKRKVVTN